MQNKTKLKNRTTTQKDKKKNTKKKTTAGTKSSHIKVIQWYRDLNREMVSGRQSSAAEFAPLLRAEANEKHQHEFCSISMHTNTTKFPMSADLCGESKY